MNPLDIAKDALRTVWSQKQLWLFGLFVAAGAGAPGARAESAGGNASAIPAWLVAVAVGAGVLGLVALAMHVVSEAALIEGVRRARDGGRLGIGEGMRLGARTFWRVLGIKALVFVAGLASVVAVAAPAVLGAVGMIPLVAGLVAAGVLALPLVLWLLTLQFLHVYALRFAVLEGRGVTAAFRDARQHLHGRIADSLKLLVVTFVGRAGAGIFAPAVVLPAAAVGGIAYLVGGLVPALIGGAIVAVPLALALTGALGTFESGVWTHGFLDARSLRA